ncbi:MAG: class I SAM-dependent methyltransferase, partial [Candidatus ainarchaeum sp.]|nr:class I SAM-dependent methyltransferase [Candidatus ainarchaeum sp.]
MALLATLRFDAAQRAFNSLYYARGGGYARDFSTYASSGTMPARAEADDFHGRLRERFGKRAGMEIRVAEIGCGNGNNARRFLERVRRLDALRGTAFAPSVSYPLADFSRGMLADAKRSALLSGHPGKILAEAANAERLEIGGGLMLARSNEVL